MTKVALGESSRYSEIVSRLDKCGRMVDNLLLSIQLAKYRRAKTAVTHASKTPHELPSIHPLHQRPRLQMDYRSGHLQTSMPGIHPQEHRIVLPKLLPLVRVAAHGYGDND